MFRGKNVALMDQSSTVCLGIQFDGKKELPCLTRMIKLSNEGEGKQSQARALSLGRARSGMRQRPGRAQSAAASNLAFPAGGNCRGR